MRVVSPVSLQDKRRSRKWCLSVSGGEMSPPLGLQRSPLRAMLVLSPAVVASAALSGYISAAMWFQGGGGGKPARPLIGGGPEVRSSLTDHAHRESASGWTRCLVRACTTGGQTEATLRPCVTPYFIRTGTRLLNGLHVMLINYYRQYSTYLFLNQYLLYY